ncbi:hypothetical protein BLOT_015927 [Blomia tropicalis]|nr:hypothetical protein BLOT_015927 [Blomia tropicalis]
MDRKIRIAYLYRIACTNKSTGRYQVDSGWKIYKGQTDPYISYPLSLLSSIGPLSIVTEIINAIFVSQLYENSIMFAPLCTSRPWSNCETLFADYMFRVEIISLSYST